MTLGIKNVGYGEIILGKMHAVETIEAPLKRPEASRMRHKRVINYLAIKSVSHDT